MAVVPDFFKSKKFLACVGVILSLVPFIFLLVIALNFATFDTEPGVIVPKSSLYKDSKDLQTYLNLTAQIGYKKYGLYGDVHVSMRQFAVDYEEIDGTDRGNLYPEWMTSKQKVGVVWFKFKESNDNLDDTIDVALTGIDLPDSSSWKRFKLEYPTDWKEIEGKKADFSIFRHVSVDNHFTMKVLRWANRAVFEFKDVETNGQAVHDLNADLKTFFEKRPQVFERHKNLQGAADATKNTDHDDVFDQLDLYYNKEVFESESNTLIFLPDPPTETKLEAQHFAKRHYNSYAEADKYLSFYDIFAKDETSAEALRKETENTKLYCLSATGGSTTRKCTSIADMKTMEPSFSPDFTGGSSARKCMHDNTEICKNNMELLILPQDFEYQKCGHSDESFEKLEALQNDDALPYIAPKEHVGLSALSLFKIDTAIRMLRDNKNSKQYLGHESLVFKAIKQTEKPGQFPVGFTDNKHTSEDENFYKHMKYETLSKLTFETGASFTANMTTWSGFRVGDDYYRIVCVQMGNFELGDAYAEFEKTNDKFAIAQRKFLSYGPSWLGFYNEVFIVFWGVIAILVPVFRLVRAYFDMKEDSTNLYLFNDKKFLEMKFFRSGNFYLVLAELGVLFFYLANIIIGIGIFAHKSHFEDEIDQIWGLGDIGKEKLETLSSLVLAFAIYLICMVITLGFDWFGQFGPVKKETWVLLPTINQQPNPQENQVQNQLQTAIPV